VVIVRAPTARDEPTNAFDCRSRHRIEFDKDRKVDLLASHSRIVPGVTDRKIADSKETVDRFPNCG